MRAPWVILGSAFTAAVLLAGAFQVVFYGVPWLGDRATERKTYPEVITRLVVEAEGNDVRVRDGEGPGVEVTRRLKWHSDRPRSRESVDGTTLTVEPLECTGRGLCDLDYTIVVPPGTEVVVRTSSGDIDTNSGDVRVRVEHPATIDVTASSGDIAVRLPAGEYDARADASSGDVSVDVDFDNDSDYRVSATASSGDIVIGYR